MTSRFPCCHRDGNSNAGFLGPGQADACSPGYTYDSNIRLMLEKKDDMRRRGAASPDQWDAVALTFAEPVVQHAGWSRRLVYPDLGVV